MYASIDPANFMKGTQVWYNSTWGAQLLEADECSMNITFISIDRTFIDTVRLPPVILPAGGCSYVNGGGNSNNNNNGPSTSTPSSNNDSKNEMDVGIGIGIGVTLAAFLVGYLVMAKVVQKDGQQPGSRSTPTGNAEYSTVAE